MRGRASKELFSPPDTSTTSFCRPTIAVNLDFANDDLPYECAVNVFDLISLSDAMEAFELGPNGGEQQQR